MKLGLQASDSSIKKKENFPEKIIDMVINGAGTRDIGRVLKVDKDTVTAVLKKKRKFS